MIAILAGAGTIALTHFKVRPHVQQIIDERNKNAKDRDTEKSAKVKALAELKSTKKDLDDTKATLTETQNQLTSTKNQLTAEQKRVADFKDKLSKSEAALSESQQKLARWNEIPLDPSQVKDLMTSEKNLLAANKALDEEKKVIFKKYTETKAQLDEYTRPEDPPMTPGLRGKVLVVDPKWSFVVLDIGEKQGAVKRGVLMISRNSRLVAKVRIASVLPERSIANIMPGWKLGEVMEGDQVLY